MTARERQTVAWVLQDPDQPHVEWDTWQAQHPLPEEPRTTDERETHP